METIRVHSAQASSLRKRLSTFVRSFISAEQIPHWSVAVCNARQALLLSKVWLVREMH